jgi:hypothetical protein
MVMPDKNTEARAKIAIPISHLFQKPSLFITELLNLADVLEIKGTIEPTFLPIEKEKVFHGNFGLCEKDFKEKFDSVGLYLKENDIKLFSCDLGPSARLRNGIHPISTILAPGEIFKISEKSLNYIRKFYQGPIALENYNYYPTGLYDHICQPIFIKQFLDKFDLGLILDLAHASVSAFNLHVNFNEYLSNLPLQRLKEIHISRPELPIKKNTLAHDSHNNPGQREWLWLENMLKIAGNINLAPIIAIEYYKNSEKLLNSVKILKTGLERIYSGQPFLEPKKSSLQNVISPVVPTL